MTDIVERLRAEARDWIVGSAVLEGADEIERLRKAVPSLAAIRDDLDRMHRHLHTIADNFEAACHVGGFTMPPRANPFS